MTCMHGLEETVHVVNWARRDMCAWVLQANGPWVELLFGLVGV